MIVAIVWPWAGPPNSVRRISMSSVPCSRSPSVRVFLGMAEEHCTLYERLVEEAARTWRHLPDEVDHPAAARELVADACALMDADGRRLQTGVGGKASAFQIEGEAIAADGVEGHLDRALSGVRLAFGDAVAHVGHAGIGDGQRFGPVTAVVAIVFGVAMISLAIFLKPYEIDAKR